MTKECKDCDHDCGHHDDDGYNCPKSFRRRLFVIILSIIVFILFIILLVWLILRPSKPKFILEDLNISQFTIIRGPRTLFTTMQATISSRNTNNRIGIFYERLDVFVEYKGQVLTQATRLPTGYQGHNDITIWSPFLCGTAIPLAPYVGDSLVQDKIAGFLLLHVKVIGQLRWKVGMWISGRYGIEVSCPAFISVFDDGTGVAKFRFQRIVSCTVDV